MISNIDDALIVKKILYVGNKNAEFKNGTKVVFHFQTRLSNPDLTLIDDSRKMGIGKPMELILGKKFQLEVWEAIVQKMSVKEIAQFTVDKSLLPQYPLVSKTLREAHKPQLKRRSHCCGVTLQNQGVGYDDLNDLLKNPTNLEFTIELLEVIQPEDYEKESWQMTEDEKLVKIPDLREKGNVEFRNKNYTAASSHYAQAIAFIEQLMLKEKPHDTEWLELQAMKNPLLLNFAQCKLFEEDYYPVIEHCTTVLSNDRDNVKALFRRAKAHVGAWNPVEAKSDFMKVMELDKSLIPVVTKELKILDELIKERNIEDKEKYKNLF